MTIRHPGYPPYIPILKWQPAERCALEEIDAELRDSFWPCIEVRGVTQHALLLAELHHSWPGTILVDYSGPEGQLTDQRYREFETFLRLISEKGYPIIPVMDSRHIVELERDIVERLVAFDSVAIRLRIESLSLTDEHFRQIEAAAETLKLTRKLLLMVDLGACPAEWSSREVKSFVAGLRDMRGCGFSTVHLASGSYPENVTSVASKGEFKRHDWRLWQEVKQSGPDLLLGYSDYGIFSPNWKEEAMKKFAKKATLRYTRMGDWLVLRADGKKREDSINLSMILVNAYADDFEGLEFSLGDRIIAERADPNVPFYKKRGSWYHIVEGWIHHIAIVIRKQY